MEIEQEISFFDQFETRYGQYDVLGERAYQRILARLTRLVQPRVGMRCIDLGCGTGAFTRRLQTFGLTLTGMDISPRSVEKARLLGGATFLVGDLADTKLDSSSFDIAVMSGVLHHITTSQRRIASLREAHRLLKPGGRFFSYDPNGLSPSMFLYRNPRSPFYSSSGKTSNEILLTKRQLEAELRAAGFENVTVGGLSGIPYRFVQDAWARRMLPLYNHLFENVMCLPVLQDAMGTFLVTAGTRT